MADRPWPVVTRESFLAVMATIPHVTKTWANVVLYGDQQGKLLAYAFNDRRFHIHPELV